MIEDLSGLPGCDVGHVAIFAKIGCGQMRRIFASDWLGCSVVTTVVAREACADHEAVEVCVNRRPYRLAGMAALAGCGAGQNMQGIAACRVHTIVALFASLADNTRIAVVEGQEHRQPDRCVMAVLAIHRCWHMGYGLALGQLAIVA